jgi:hypothetical protein
MNCSRSTALLVEHLGDALVGVRVEEAEGQVLQLPLQLPDAEAVGERRIDVERLARHLGAQVVLMLGEKRRVCVRLARRSSTTRMSSTIASSILRSTSICAFISAGLASPASMLAATKPLVIGRRRLSREMP